MLFTKQKYNLNLTYKIVSKFGRSRGKICSKHRGGGLKKKMKIIDYTRNLWNVPAFVLSLEKTKTNSPYLALLLYPIGILTYIIAPKDIKIGSKIFSGDVIPISVGNNTYLKNIPLNLKIHNIESYPNSGAKYIKSAGLWAKIIDKSATHAFVIFKNNTIKKLSIFCTATIGEVSNSSYFSSKLLYKAGQTRKLLNKRPKVRGVAKNPVDHPHGGGNGKKSPKNPNYNFKRKLPKHRKLKKKNEKL